MIKPTNLPKPGTRSPLLLTPIQNYVLFTVFFTGNIVVLIALLAGAARNHEALESIAKSAELAWEREPVQKAVDKTPLAGTSSDAPSGGPGVIRLSVPEDWQWRGCRMAEGARSVEVLFSQPPR